jgi:hypothetical protein
MNYLNKMYSRSNTPAPATSQKNPNRVLGGLRGQGVDHYSVLGEDGVERNVPTQKYVQGLEQKVRDQETRLSVLEKRVRSVTNDQRSTATAVQAIRRNP